jgi:hypothetical protein
MGKVITEGSDIQCEHGAAVTPVSTAVKAVLEVAGKGVLAGTLADSTIASANCTQQPPPNSNVPCAAIVAQTAGPSSVLFVGSDAVLLEDAAGTTSGAPKNRWSVQDAKQQLLTVQ